jgi:mannose-6-phosphate isomerase
MKIIDKPWGYEVLWSKTDKYAGKLIHINKGQKLSLQYHNVKDETIYVLKGTLYLVYHHDVIEMNPGDSQHIPAGVTHRMIAPEHCDVELMEVSTPELDDVVRLQDEYGRV